MTRETECKFCDWKEKVLWLIHLTDIVFFFLFFLACLAVSPNINNYILLLRWLKASVSFDRQQTDTLLNLICNKCISCKYDEFIEVVRGEQVKKKSENLFSLKVGWLFFELNLNIKYIIRFIEKFWLKITAIYVWLNCFKMFS